MGLSLWGPSKQDQYLVLFFLNFTFGRAAEMEFSFSFFFSLVQSPFRSENEASMSHSEGGQGRVQLGSHGCPKGGSETARVPQNRDGFAGGCALPTATRRGCRLEPRGAFLANVRAVSMPGAWSWREPPGDEGRRSARSMCVNTAAACGGGCC